MIPSDPNIIQFDVEAKNFMDLPNDTVAVSKLNEILKKFHIITDEENSK